jgi:hypothetical protein
MLLPSGGSAAPPTGRTRPLCPYPQTAICNGSDDINKDTSFHCGGNLEKREIVSNDVLTRYKHEVNGNLNFKGTGLEPHDCGIRDDDHHDDHEAKNDDDDRD